MGVESKPSTEILDRDLERQREQWRRERQNQKEDGEEASWA